MRYAQRGVCGGGGIRRGVRRSWGELEPTMRYAQQVVGWWVAGAGLLGGWTLVAAATMAYEAVNMGRCHGG